MKKIVLSLVLSLSTLMAGSSGYMGIAIEGLQSFSSKNTNQVFGKEDESGDIKSNAYGFKLQVGGEAEAGMRSNFTFGMSQYQDDLFPKDFSDPKTSKDNGFIYSFGLELQKSFLVSSAFAPLLVGGFEFGFMNIDGFIQDSANFTAWKIGTGMLNRFSTEYEFETQIFYRYRSWGDYNYNQADTSNVTVQENTVNVSIGLNFHY